MVFGRAVPRRPGGWLAAEFEEFIHER